MTFETKYSQGDIVWFMEGMKATKGSIVIIKIYTYQSGEMLIKYGVSVYAGTRDYNEYELFKTKQDLLNSL